MIPKQAAFLLQGHIPAAASVLPCSGPSAEHEPSTAPGFNAEAVTMFLPVVLCNNVYLLYTSETKSPHAAEPGPPPLHSMRCPDHFYQKSFPQEVKDRPSKMH